MKERSGMPYDVVAYEADDQAMLLNECEEGLFHRMLRRSWMNGSIPEDLTSLVAVCRTHPARLKKAWKKIAPLWQPHPALPGRLINLKQELERAYKEEKSNTNSKAAKERWKQQKIKEITDANAERTQSKRTTSPPYPRPIPNPIPTHPEEKSKKGEESGAGAPEHPVLVPEPVHQFGEFRNVKLTESEYKKLEAKLNSHLDGYIDRLDRWGAENPEKFRKKKSHYATILNWFGRDAKEGKTDGNGSYQKSSKEQRIDAAFNEAARILEADGASLRYGASAGGSGIDRQRR